MSSDCKVSSAAWLSSPLQQLVNLQQGQSPAASVLVCGAEGLGKKSLIQAVAQYRLCQAPNETQACGTCKSCRQYTGHSNPDVLLVEQEPEKSQILIEQIRAAIEWVQLTSHQGKGRVLIIHAAHKMNESAANSLLKTLEEPPDNVLIMLESSQLNRILPTIRSRCMIQRIPVPAALEAQAWIEGQAAHDTDAIEQALLKAEGAPWQALKILDEQSDAQNEAELTIFDFLSGRLNPLTAASQLAAIENFIPSLESAISRMATSLEADLIQSSKQKLEALEGYDPESLLNWLRELMAVRRLAETPLNRQQLCESVFLSAPKKLRKM